MRRRKQKSLFNNREQKEILTYLKKKNIFGIEVPCILQPNFTLARNFGSGTEYLHSQQALGFTGLPNFCRTGLKKEKQLLNCF